MSRLAGNLAGSHVVVTGASSGIGRALCRMLVGRSARVTGLSRRPDSLSAEVTAVRADLTRADDIHAAFAAIDALDDAGPLDALVNAAGVAYLAGIRDGEPAQWEEMWRVNVHALALCSQLAMRRFPDGAGCIVNVSSMSGHRVPPTGGFYSPTKFAVRGVTDALRLEARAAGLKVRVGSISPGFVDTPLLDTYFHGREDQLAETRASMTMLQPDDVAEAIVAMLETPPHVEIGDIQMRSVDQKA